MILKDYYAAQSIDEVVTLLNQSKKNIILGGTHWLKLGTANYNLGIDIANLGLDQITECNSDIEIGAHVSLRQLETDPLIHQYAAILQDALAHIVGIQFRNTARIGASIYSHFGFSDITTALLTMDTQVEIDGHERVPLSLYLNLPRRRHFVTKIIIKKEHLTFNYQSMRQDQTGLPYCIVAMSCNSHKEWRVSVGARPAGAVLAHKASHYLNKGGSDPHKAFNLLESEVALHDNPFASKAYRTHLVKTFLERGILDLWK